MTWVSRTDPRKKHNQGAGRRLPNVVVPTHRVRNTWRDTRLTSPLLEYSSAEQRAAAAERNARRQARRMVQVRAHHDARGDRRAAARQAGARAHVRVGSLPALTTDARLARSQVAPRVGAGGARALHARADGQRAAAAGGANRCRAQKKFAPAAGALASLRSRAQLPAAPHASLPCGAAARRPPLVTRAAQEMDWPLCLYAAMSLRRYVSTLLCRCVAMSLRCYVATPLCRYAAMSLSVFAATSLCREMCTRVCDGRAVRMCVMAVQRCTGVVGTCVARPRPQSAFANG